MIGWEAEWNRQRVFPFFTEIRVERLVFLWYAWPKMPGVGVASTGIVFISHLIKSDITDHKARLADQVRRKRQKYHLHKSMNQN